MLLTPAVLDAETAGFWLDVLAGLALGGWVAGARFTWSTRRLLREPLSGECEVQATPTEVRTALLATLAQAQQISPLSQARITRATDDEVEWTVARGPHRHRGLVKLSADGASATRATYGIASESPLVRIAAWIVAAGLVVTLGIYFLLQTYAVESAHEGARGQVFQMLQAVHLLWPPFLCGFLARRIVTATADEVERTLQNAAFRSA